MKDDGGLVGACFLAALLALMFYGGFLLALAVPWSADAIQEIACERAICPTETVTP